MNFIMSHRVSAWNEECEKLKNLSLCQYGGGEDFKLASMMKEHVITHDFMESLLLRELVTTHSNEFIDAYAKIPIDQQVANIPRLKLKENDIQWKYTILLSSSIPNAFHYNVLTHGRVFSNEFNDEPNRLGASSWPLIGLYDTYNISTDFLVTKESFTSKLTGNISPWLGFNWVNAVDQHCHWVDEQMVIDGFPIDLSTWHIGGDMGRFSVENVDEISFAWVGWICPVRKLGQLSLVIILPESNSNITKLSEFVSEDIYKHCEELINK